MIGVIRHVPGTLKHTAVHNGAHLGVPCEEGSACVHLFSLTSLITASAGMCARQSPAQAYPQTLSLVHFKATFPIGADFGSHGSELN
jgi:hypothetical protein